jgi:hypothetical protein
MENKRYHSLSPEEKKAWNRALWKKRKADPKQMEKARNKVRAWKLANPDAHAEHNRKSINKRRSENPVMKITCNLRGRLRDIIGSAQKGGTAGTRDLIGCSSADLARHLESQFRYGMTWGNYGFGWHVDHIQPCASFDHSNPDHVRRCWHFTNLRPMWASENLAKGDRITEPQMRLGV